MAVQRCPECGRVVDGDATDCLACGHSWSAGSAPSPATPRPVSAPTPVAAGPANPFGGETSGAARPTNPFGGSSRGPAKPFGAPSLAPHVAANPFAAGTPKPVTGLHAGRVAPDPESGPEPIRPPSQEIPTTSASPARPLPQDKTEDGIPPDDDALPALESAPPPPPPRNGVERFLRSPIAFPAIGGVVFFSTLILGLVIAFSGRDELLDQIDSGKQGARDVAKALSGVEERTPREDLLLGHAQALLGQYERALRAYHSSAQRGAVDDRALDYALLALDNPFESALLPREVLAVWPPGKVDDRLRELTRASAWHKRHNALDALGKRGKGSHELRLDVAYRDLADESVKGCKQINDALDVVRDYGRGDRALDAIADFRKTDRLRCATDRLQEVEREVKARG